MTSIIVRGYSREKRIITRLSTIVVLIIALPVLPINVGAADSSTEETAVIYSQQNLQILQMIEQVGQMKAMANQLKA